MQMETHKMDELTENMFNNVNHLIECQRFVMERVEFLEAKRVEITNMIQNISSSSYKETLEIQINKMEMKLSINCVTHKIKDKEVVIDDSVEKKKKNIKCRYNDRGYCKTQSECVFLHSDIICDKVFSNSKCSDSKECLLRHPKDCKHWMGDSRGCLRGDVCKYLHQSSKKGIHIKSNKNYHDTKSETENRRDKHEIIIEKQNDDNVLVLKEAIAAKEEDIKRMDENNSKLISENEGLIEENNRFQRILKNMNQEIKLLRSRTK